MTTGPAHSPRTAPLAPVQAAMIRDALASPAAGRNVQQVEIVLTPDITGAQVAEAWRATVENVGVLRARFVIAGGFPTGLEILTSAPLLRIETAEPPSWERWLETDRATPLPLESSVPWRAAHWPVSRRWIWTFHHALLDGRSITAVLRHFLSRLGGGNPEPLALARWEPPSEEEIARADATHRKAFANLETRIPEFPLDRANGPFTASRSLGTDLADQFQAVEKSLRTSAATLVTWAWGRAMAGAAGAECAAIGQVRSGPPCDGSAGFTMNTIPVVVGDMKDFRSHLLELRAIERVSPLDLPGGIFAETDGPWSSVVMVSRGTQRQLTGEFPHLVSLEMHERGGEPLLASAWLRPDFRLAVETDGSRHGPRAAEALLGLWEENLLLLAGRAIRRPAAVLSGGPPAAAMHLAAAWRDSAAAHAALPALRLPDREITYAELDARVRHLAARLTPGGVIVSYLENRDLLAEVVLAIARAGAIHVPLDPDLPAERLAAIVRDTGPVMIVTDTPAIGGPSGPPCLIADGGTGGDCPVPFSNQGTETLAILHTSGSTGAPKGVMLHHAGVVNEAVSIARLTGLGPGDRLLQLASAGFDASLEEILATLLSGATLVPRPAGLAADFAVFQEFIRSAGVTALDLSTAHWSAWCAWMAGEEQAPPAALRVVIIGGERASAAALATWFQAGGGDRLLLNTYGPTETCIVATAQHITGAREDAGDPPIGRPLPGLTIRIAGPRGDALPPGAAGELWIGGTGVGPGYWGRPDLTDASFVTLDGERWYRSGDRACGDESGRLHFLGRIDDQLKIRGNRVEPDEVIRVLERFPGVGAAHVGGLGEETVLAAWVRWKATPPDSWPSLLTAHAARFLPVPLIPTRWAAVGEFPLTERGKIDRRALPEPLATASAASVFEAPATRTEERMAATWRDLLGIGRVGRDESFFELGGHSLLALRLFSRLAKDWGLKLPMALLLHAPTLRGFCAAIDGAPPVMEGRPVVMPVQAGGSSPPLFCIHGGDGGVIFYRNLARHLPPDRPLLAIECPALSSDGEIEVVPIEETAASYLAALRAHQPRGPYHLGGYSYGGVVVFEMARQLIEAGETIGFLGLFDTVNPNTKIREYRLLERAEIFWRAQTERSPLARLRRICQRTREGLRTHFQVKAEVAAALSAESTAAHTPLRGVRLREAHWQALGLYQACPVACAAVLFKTDAVDDKFDIPADYGWRGLVADLEIVAVPGEHLTLFSPKHAATLAREILKRL